MQSIFSFSFLPFYHPTNIMKIKKLVFTSRRKAESFHFQTRYHSRNVNCAHNDGVDQSVQKIKKIYQFFFPRSQKKTIKYAHFFFEKN